MAKEKPNEATPALTDEQKLAAFDALVAERDTLQESNINTQAELDKKKIELEQLNKVLTEVAAERDTLQATADALNAKAGVSGLDKNVLKAKADEVFKAYPNAVKVLVSSDGYCFTDENSALCYKVAKGIELITFNR